MPDDPLPRRRWLLAGIPLCLLMTVVEALRAFDGNTRSIAYTIEWPVFAAFLVYLYRQLGKPLPDAGDEDDADAR